MHMFLVERGLPCNLCAAACRAGARDLIASREGIRKRRAGAEDIEIGREDPRAAP